MSASIHVINAVTWEPAAASAPTSAQSIAGERLASAASRLHRITSRSFLTPEAKAQAIELRKECERVCAELRRAGI